MPSQSRRAFRHEEFAADELTARKHGRTIAVCIPARDEEATIGTIIDTIHRDLVLDQPLVDELIVMDDQSTDETAAIAARAGATVVSTSDVLPHLAKGPGKGQALWKSLHVTTSDLVVWCDADIADFDGRFVTGIVGPLLADPDIGFVKGHYRRPIEPDGSGGGRVTELVARPVLSLLFPELTHIVQPLSGEYGGRRELLERVPFASGYGVELGLLVDLADRFGSETIAQVDLGERRHRNRGLDELGPQAAAILHTALRRAAPDLLAGPVPLARPGHDAVDVDIDEHPPLITLAEHRARDIGPDGSAGVETPQGNG